MMTGNTFKWHDYTYTLQDGLLMAYLHICIRQKEKEKMKYTCITRIYLYIRKRWQEIHTFDMYIYIHHRTIPRWLSVQQRPSATLLHLSVLQCVAVCCSVAVFGGVCGSVLQQRPSATLLHLSILQCAAVCGSIAVCGSVLQCVAVCCSKDPVLRSIT